MSTEAADKSVQVPQKSQISTLRVSQIRERIQEFVVITGARPTYLTGAASLWDFTGVLIPQVEVSSNIVARSSVQALTADWEAVGHDLRAILPPPDDI